MMDAKISTSKYLPRTASITYTTRVKVWEFPKHRFFEYEARDEPWCRELGIGREVEREVVYNFPNAIIVECTDNSMSIVAAPTPRDDLVFDY